MKKTVLVETLNLRDVSIVFRIIDVYSIPCLLDFRIVIGLYERVKFNKLFPAQPLNRVKCRLPRINQSKPVNC